MYIPHQTILIIHEERVNEMLGKNIQDPDKGIGKSIQRVLNNMRDTLQDETNIVEATSTRGHRTTQEMALVGEK
jgi:hypothetical protein